MSAALELVERVKALGVTMTPITDGIRLEPGSRVPKELVEGIRQHKVEIIAILTKPSGTLTAALTQKNDEIAVMRRRLASPYYAGDVEYLEWGKDVIACLTSHIEEIRRYLREGGTLRLPPCCKEEGYICLIAMRRFDGCLMGPGECGFAISPQGPEC